MRTALCIVLLLGVSFSISEPAQSQGIHTVALSGQRAPGTAGDVRFGSFSAPQLNSDGQVAFQAHLIGDSICCGIFGGVSNKSGIWTGDTGSLALAVRDGDQASGLPTGVRYSTGYNVDNFANFAFSSNGYLAFVGGLAGAGVDNFNSGGVWSIINQSTSLAFRFGDHAPGMPANVTFGGEGKLKINSAGRLSLSWELLKDGGANNAVTNSIWSGSTGALALIANEGDHAPGMPADVTFGGINYLPGTSSEHVAFYAQLIGGGFNYSNNSTVWSNRTGALELVARVDGQAPGMPNGVVFAWIRDEVLLNTNDNTAFTATLKGPGVSDPYQAIWSDVSGSLSQFVHIGERAPGTVDGVTFNGFYDIAMNNSGKIAFNGFLTGAGVNEQNQLGIWTNGTSPLRLVARQGDPAPGIDGKVWGLSGSTGLNEVGQVAFTSILTDPAGYPWDGPQSLWAEDKAGIVRLIVREGSQIEVAPGDTRTVQSFEYARDIDKTNGDGSSSAFNVQGQFAFRARFTDGTSGIFISDIAAVPEPCFVALLAPIIIITLYSRHRRPSSSPK